MNTYNENIIYLDKNGKEFFPSLNAGEVFKPEKGLQTEIGLRYELDKKLDLNASIFYINKNNIVRTLATLEVEEEGAVVNKSVQGQVGRAVSKGFDLSLTYRPLPNLQIVGGWGWSDFRYKKTSIDTSKWDYMEKTNIRATGVPRTTAYAYADYEITKGIFKSLAFHLSATYTDRIYRDITNNLYYPSRILMDAGAYYTLNKYVELSFMAYNLFDKKYFVDTLS